MNTLIQNNINTFGEKGRVWIGNLPNIIEQLATYWNLSHIVPVENMTFNYVAKAKTNTNLPVVLKISCDEKSLTDEIQALKYFDGDGSIQLIAHNEKFHAMLLQQAIPGTTLKSIYPSQLEYVMDCYIETMHKLHNKPLLNNNHFLHIRDWLVAIDNLKNSDIPVSLIKKAIALKNKLLGSMNTSIFLHGDLHHDNILKHADLWLAIDPKGIVGEPEFEIAAFDFMYVSELANMHDVKNIFAARINLLAEKAKLDPQRVHDWVFVRLMLMAAWQMEDKGDASFAIKLAIELKNQT